MFSDMNCMRLSVMHTQFMRQTSRGVKFKNIISNILFTRVWIEYCTHFRSCGRSSQTTIRQGAFKIMFLIFLYK